MAFIIPENKTILVKIQFLINQFDYFIFFCLRNEFGYTVKPNLDEKSRISSLRDIFEKTSILNLTKTL